MCSHEIVWHGMCTECGVAVKETRTDSVQLLGGIRISQNQMNAEKKQSGRQLVGQKKLILILDLDHTLLNTCQVSELTEKEKNSLRYPIKDVHASPHMMLVTKLRPGVRDFLKMAGELFLLHVYTMGNRPYALRMAKILDPDGALFKERVISMNDSTDARSKDIDVILGNENQIAIVDDTPSIWKKHRNNVVCIERYHYFAASRRIYGPAGPSLLMSNTDEKIEESPLMNAGRVLREMHAGFFSQADEETADVRAELVKLKKRILLNVHIVFSGYFPSADPNPERHPIWIKAEELGAVCERQMTEQTTHVVAYKTGTEKTIKARRRGLHIVSANWLKASDAGWKRENEDFFSLE